MENKKIFCGNGRNFGKYGQIGINVCLTDIPSEYIQTSKNGKKYVKLKINKLKEPAKDRDYYIEVDTWKPGQSNNNINNNNTVSKDNTYDIDANSFIDNKEDIPF
jgi:hypothetical protein